MKMKLLPLSVYLFTLVQLSSGLNGCETFKHFLCQNNNALRLNLFRHGIKWRKRFSLSFPLSISLSLSLSRERESLSVYMYIFNLILHLFTLREIREERALPALSFSSPFPPFSLSREKSIVRHIIHKISPKVYFVNYVKVQHDSYLYILICKREKTF